jgi:hypothetical protein
MGAADSSEILVPIHQTTYQKTAIFEMYIWLHSAVPYKYNSLTMPFLSCYVLLAKSAQIKCIIGSQTSPIIFQVARCIRLGNYIKHNSHQDL